MARLLLFHHALGQTPGFHAFADTLRSAGHTVHTPDFFGGRTFASLDEGVAHVDTLRLAEVCAMADAAADEVPDARAHVGFSFGALAAQYLAQTRPGTAGAVLCHGSVPTDVFARPWPAHVALQIHTMEADPWTEADVVTALAAEALRCQVFRYPGAGHLFAEPGSDDYDPQAAALLTERVLAFLDRVHSS